MARVLRYVTTDAMGSVTSVLSSTGEVLERRSYDAFGQMTCMLPDGTPVATSPTGLKVGFHGQLMDQLTRMYQMGYRWYSPLLGRWASRDPIGLEGGVNPNTFCRNIPTDAHDTFGLIIDIGQSGISVGKPNPAVYGLGELAAVPDFVALEATPQKKSISEFINGSGAKQAIDALCKRCDRDKIPRQNFHIAIVTGHGSPGPDQPGIVEFRKGRLLPGRPPFTAPDGTHIPLDWHVIRPADVANKVKIRTEEFSHHTSAVLLLSCYGATGTAQAIANRLQIPVVATSDIVWARNDSRNGAVWLSLVRRVLAGETYAPYSLEADRETQVRSDKTSSTWVVIMPASRPR